MELSIVVTILMILAGMAIPAFSDSVDNAEVAAAQSMLSRVRTAVDFYAFQHQEQFPGMDSNGIWSAATLDAQLRMASDADGNTAAQGTAGYPYGPYLTESFPANPFNDLETVLVVQPGAVFAGPDDNTGWIFWADTGAFKINSTATDSNGDPVFNL